MATKEKPTVSDAIIDRAFESWCYELAHRDSGTTTSAFELTPKMVFAAAFALGHKDGRATMVGAFVDFADAQQAKAK